jgi:hypothetical protein
MTPRAVFDCMVFLQGAGRPAGPAAACLQLLDEEKVVLCVSAEILPAGLAVCADAHQRLARHSPGTPSAVLQGPKTPARSRAYTRRMKQRGRRFPRPPRCFRAHVVATCLSVFNLSKNNSPLDRHRDGTNQPSSRSKPCRGV